MDIISFQDCLKENFITIKQAFSDFKTEAIVKTREFLESLERCSLLISEKYKAAVKCKFNTSELQIDCKTVIM